MTDSTASGLPAPTPDQRRVAAGQCERANEALAAGNHDYAIELLLNCCKLDAANLIYRQALRQAQRGKYKNNGRGSRFALLTNSAARLRLKSARGKRDHARALECAEEILTRNPWDLGAQAAMAESFEALGLRDQAIWTLEQARHKNARNAAVNRRLARLCEKHGDFKRALHLWSLVRKAEPTDVEAQQKLKDLAAHETIARGRYEQALQGGEGAAKEGPRLEPVPAPPEVAAPQLEAMPASLPAGDRMAHESAPLLAKIKAEPTRPDAYLRLAALYRRADRTEEARAVSAQGLERTGNPFELAAELADLETEPFRQNLAIAEERLRDRPEDEELRKLRIRLLKEINTRELYLYRQKAERYPAELVYRYELGVRLLRAGQLDEAILELQAARADPRYHWRALVNLGYAFKNRNNWRLAQRNFEDALQHLPAGEEALRKEVLFLLANGAAEAGDLAKALRTAEELANLDFAYRDVGRLMDEWQALLGQAGPGGEPSPGPLASP